MFSELAFTTCYNFFVILMCFLPGQGVCFALPCTEPLSLCYANRSAALYHLHHYQVS